MKLLDNGFISSKDILEGLFAEATIEEHKRLESAVACLFLSAAIHKNISLRECMETYEILRYPAQEGVVFERIQSDTVDMFRSAEYTLKLSKRAVPLRYEDSFWNKMEPLILNEIREKFGVRRYFKSVIDGVR